MIWRLFHFIVRRSSEKGWRQVLAQEGLPGEQREVIVGLLIPAGINVIAFMNNTIWLESGGMPQLHGQDGVTPTLSAREFTHTMDRPRGYPIWFLAAFPDVASWVSNVVARANLYHEEKASILLEDMHSRLSQLSPAELDAASERIGIRHARILVDWYRQTTNKRLECSA
ncbi:MAG: hypothetical protein Q8S00_23380 [Deltaproteobacteria bacterium]|nr:hypothetical protein [Deltaproteobacteria bacterium]